MYAFVVPIRLTLMDQMAHVAREQGKTLVPLNDDLPLFDSGPDSLGVAVLVARLEGRLDIAAVLWGNKCKVPLQNRLTLCERPTGCIASSVRSPAVRCPSSAL